MNAKRYLPFDILCQFLLFLLVRQAAMYGASWLLVQMAAPAAGNAPAFLFVTEEGGVAGFTGNASAIISVIGFAAGAGAVSACARELIGKSAEEMRPQRQKRMKRKPWQSLALAGIATLTLAPGLNLLFTLTGITDKSATYQRVAQDQYSAYFLVGIVCYGVLSPIAEEVLFRGIVYNYLKDLLDLRRAFVLGAAVFGVYHMNVVQGVYAFLMSFLIIGAYEYFGSFLAPVCVHMASNILAYCLTYTSVAVTGVVSWPVCVGLLAVGAGSLYLLWRQGKIVGKAAEI